eukprot:3595895-Heterocapsa_arctica.AAC.1
MRQGCCPCPSNTAHQGHVSNASLTHCPHRQHFNNNPSARHHGQYPITHTSHHIFIAAYINNTSAYINIRRDTNHTY